LLFLQQHRVKFVTHCCFYSIVSLLLRHRNAMECLGFSHGHSHCLSSTDVSKVSTIVFS
jgi:hypothetical protein